MVVAAEVMSAAAMAAMWCGGCGGYHGGFEVVVVAVI